MEQYSGVSFHLNTQKHMVLAHVLPGSQAEPVTKDTILEEIERNFSDYLVDDSALKVLLKYCTENKDDCELEIAALRPARISLELSDDKTSVVARVFPHGGMDKVTEQLIQSLFKDSEYRDKYKLQADAVFELETLCADAEKDSILNIAKFLYASVNFEIDKSGRQLVAKIIPHKTVTKYSQNELLEKLEEFEGFVLQPIESLMSVYNATNKEVTAQVGVKREPKVVVISTDNGRYLQAHFTPAMGDMAITRQWLQEQLSCDEYKDYQLLEYGAKEVLDVCH